MGYRKLLVSLLLVLSVSVRLQSQHHISSGNLRVRVVFSDDRALNFRARLQLMNGASNNTVDEAYTDDHGEAEFSRIAIGSYHIIVTGDDIQETDSGVFDVDERKTTQSIMISVRRRGEGEKHQGPGGTVAAADLHIPAEASTEFNQAAALMSKESWKDAIPKLQRAVTIYPKYVDAYTDLGVVYSRLGQWDLERESLNKALGINDHFAPALLNLGMLEIREKHYPEAEGLLQKASAGDPTNVQTLALLSQTQLLDKRFDAAVATSEKAHSLPHVGFAIVHYIAARALLHENRIQDAVAQFQTMLQEEPTGPRADAVRNELNVLQASAH